MLTPELLDKLYENLKHGTTHFAYRKRSGELRIAKGTTSLSIIPDESHPKGTGTEKEGIKAYWDENVQGWRAFDPMQVVWASYVGADALTIAEQEAINQYKQAQSL